MKEKSNASALRPRVDDLYGVSERLFNRGGVGVQTCRIVFSEAVRGIGTRKRRKIFISQTA